MKCIEVAKIIIDIIQGIVIISVTLFTARWTFKTFAHKEKIEELKELKKMIELYHSKLKIFCAQVRDNETPDSVEIGEKLELAQIHNKLVSLASLNLYTKSDFRKKVQNIVGKWITGNRVNIMQRRKNSTYEEIDIVNAWQEFENEHNEVKVLIDKEASRLF